MKSKILLQIIILLAFGTAALYAGATILKLTAKSEGGNVILDWETGQEVNLNKFVIERKTAAGSFVDIAEVRPQANRTYEYIDASAYKTTDAVYVYRLRIVDNGGGVTYSGEVAVSHNTTGVAKKTWGSIKALFSR